MDNVRHASPPKQRGTSRRTARRSRKGGWRSPSGLTWTEVKDISRLAHAADFNVYLDIMPCEGSDQQRKRWCVDVVRKLGQSLKRRGRPHIGVTTFEKSSAASLHGHHICRIEKRDFDLLDRYSNETIVARSFVRSRLSQVVAYRTKQRLPLSPTFEAVTNHQRQKGAPIRGRRASFTRAAREFLASLQ
jgi:hypothetical protein